MINWLNKKVFTQKQWARKFTHTATGCIVCTFPWFLNPLQIVVLSGVFTLLMSISKIKKILVLHNVSRNTWGEVYFPASVGICALISLPNYVNAFLAGILCLTFADTSANILGNLIPLKIIKIGSQTKSIGGFIACTLVVFIIFAILFQPICSNWFVLLAISIIIGFTEIISIYGTDNITVPIAATLLGLLLT